MVDYNISECIAHSSLRTTTACSASDERKSCEVPASLSDWHHDMQCMVHAVGWFMDMSL